MRRILRIRSINVNTIRNGGKHLSIRVIINENLYAKLNIILK